MPAQMMTEELERFVAGILGARAEIKHLRSLLSRALAVADQGYWRDGARLSLKSHPLWDDIREAIHQDTDR